MSFFSCSRCEAGGSHSLTVRVQVPSILAVTEKRGASLRRVQTFLTFKAHHRLLIDLMRERGSMTVTHVTATLRICATAVGFSLLAAAAVPATTTVPASFLDAARAVPMVYAVNEFAFSATAYREFANGNVPPVLAIAGNRTKIFQPNGLAVAPTGKVAITESDQSSNPNRIHEYAPGASGNVAPIATITCGGLGGVPLQAAFDSQSNLYVNYFEGGHAPSGAIAVFAPDEQVGCIKGNHVIFGNRTGIRGEGGITVAHGMIYSAEVDSVKEFRATDNGNVAPRITIQGANTGLQFADGVSVDGAGFVYIANGNDIRIFTPSARGDVAPVAVIAGNRTQFLHATGVAVGRDGRIFVADGNNGILVFASGAHGNVFPIQVISGSKTGLNGIAEIALRE